MNRVFWLVLLIISLQGCVSQPTTTDRDGDTGTGTGETDKAIQRDRNCARDHSTELALSGCFEKLRNLERDSILAADQAEIINQIGAELRKAKEQIKALEQTNTALEDDLKKKDDALKRLRELTLGS